MASEFSDIKSLSFEEALQELEALSQKLSQGGMPLEQSVEAYARGSALRKHCSDLLRKAEDRVRELDKEFGNEETEDIEADRSSKKSKDRNDDIPF